MYPKKPLTLNDNVILVFKNKFLFTISGWFSHQGASDQLFPFLLAGLTRASVLGAVHHAHHQSDSRLPGTF